jgi:hypothetical protein
MSMSLGLVTALRRIDVARANPSSAKRAASSTFKR